MNEKKTYLVKTSMNFSIGTDEFYLTAGSEVELPEHELINSLILFKHIELVEKPKALKDNKK